MKANAASALGRAATNHHPQYPRSTPPVNVCVCVCACQDISDGRVRLRAGTLYTALDRLCTAELVEVDREEIVDSRLRRYYRLTPLGEEELAIEAARLHSNASTALARLNPVGGVAT